jgi:tRNA U34 5-methylaminomethyl-2-thiouridine-forming methyltransferase MnmC
MMNKQIKHKLRSGREVELKLSEDGSHTLYVPELDEHYHSVYGARTESMHVFIDTGLEHITKKNIRILEIGFGTGLNALLTALHKGEKIIEYHSLEKYPLNPGLENILQFAEKEDNETKAVFNKIHKADWNKPADIIPGFKLLKLEADLLTYEFTKKYDLIYFDAFAPDVQPELWTIDIFRKLYNTMNPAAVLTTYSAKGTVRRALQSAGFSVERLPGPPGKREMLRAVKN